MKEKLKFSIKLLTDKSLYPYDLLLLADPSIEAIKQYLSQGECYIASIQQEILGVIILQKTKNFTFEIKNVSVSPKYQKKGIGSKLISYCILQAKAKHAKQIEIATGNSSIYQLALYQKLGFKIQSIQKNYFLKYYPNPIFENRIQCTDKIILRYTI